MASTSSRRCFGSTPVNNNSGSMVEPQQTGFSFTAQDNELLSSFDEEDELSVTPMLSMTHSGGGGGHFGFGVTPIPIISSASPTLVAPSSSSRTSDGIDDGMTMMEAMERNQQQLAQQQQQQQAYSSASLHEPLGVQDAGLMNAVDMLCDDMFLCKTDVLRQFARSRGIAGGSKVDVVIKLVQQAHKHAHGDSTDLSHTKRFLGGVFADEVRTSGLRSQWTNASLEASHVEMACERHAKFASMSNSSKKLMVRKASAESSRLLRRLTRPFQDEYQQLSNAAVGGVHRQFKEELDQLVDKWSITELVSPFCSYLVSSIRHTTSTNLMTRTEATVQLVQADIIRPTVEDGDASTLEQYMRLLEKVVDEVNRREIIYGDQRMNWGTDTGPVIMSSIASFEAAAAANKQFEFDEVPEWVQGYVKSFASWEAIVRNDIPLFADLPPRVFHALLLGVTCWKILTLIHGDAAKPSDIPRGYGAALKQSLIEFYLDDAKASDALNRLMAYVQAPSDRVRGGVTVRPEIFPCILQQLQSAFHEANDEHMPMRVALVFREISLTTSRCERAYGLLPLMVRLTEDLKFHLRFAEVFRHLNTKDRNTVRNSNVHMIKTLMYFEKELGISAPVSTKSTAFLVVILLYLSSRSNGTTTPAILERYASVTGRDEFGVVSLTEISATNIHELKVALPPQLSYSSWLQQGDTKEKTVYSVIPSTAVKGASNQAMLISQAPMMKALDAISRVPWRINKYMLHVQEAMIREGFGFGKIRPGFYPLHYCNMRDGTINHDSLDEPIYNTQQHFEYHKQQDTDWRNLQDTRSSRVHYLQALRQARSLVQFSHLYFPNSMDFRGRMYPIPGRLNHTGSDPFRALLEYAEPKPLGKVGLYWLKVHVANKMGMSKLSFDERVQYVDEHTEDVIRSAESPLHGEKWWQEAAEPMQCLMACKELADALKHSQGAENFPSRIGVAVDGSYNGLQHYSAIGRDAFGAELVNLVPSERPADAYTGILKEMLKSIQADSSRDHQVAQRCLGTGKGLDRNHIKRKTIKRPIMTQVYGVTGYGMSEQILDELVKQNAAHGLWTPTDMKEMAAYLREKVLDSLGVTFRETQLCRKWLSEVTELIWEAQPAETRNAFTWTTPLGLVVRQPYRVRKEHHLFTVHGYSRIPGDSVSPASRKQLSALAPNLIHSLDATHLAMTALEMQNRGLSMMAVHDSYWTYACDLPELSSVLRQQFVNLYDKYDPLWELKEQWEESFFMDLRRHGVKLPDPPKRGDLDLRVVLNSPYFFS
ncbi:mitochondrial DNA-directed RNA polymerase, putative [Bodo saltans]|uniref:DNA-directed RNA polymerase n=1 Tax=Bodo saltans TaxID=75058 RepID=A0A0S4J6R7_BODSA|nr:mitochondrial DNA-directed RNA polymerase, putative [Bodo saltans]|eukprot:CUG70007.1 mitochondrial DNA-directed RNA polymerase, putative [Bodo saltans]